MASPPLRGIVHLYDEKKKNEMIWDDTHFPLMTLLTNGTPSIGLLEQAFSLRDPLLDYASKNGIQAVLISDLARVKTPDAATRKAIAELAKAKDTPYQGVLLATVFLVTNPLIRGVITAISWIAGEAMVPNIYTADIAGALKEMTKLYGAVGKDLPHFPADYQFAPTTL